MNQSYHKYITTNGSRAYPVETDLYANTLAAAETGNDSSCGCGCSEESDASENCGTFCPDERCGSAKETCCRGIGLQTDGSLRTGYLPAYVDVVFDRNKAAGSQIANAVTVTSGDAPCGFSAVYKSCSGCCTVPTIDESSCFHVENFYARIRSASPAREVTGMDVMINNIPADDGSVTELGENSFRVPLSAFDTLLSSERCTECGKGTKATVIIAMGGLPISYIAEYVLCGYVTTAEGTYQFEIVLTDPEEVTTEGTTSFYLPEVCLPTFDYDENAFLKIDFSYKIGLVAPTLSADGDGVITLTDTVILQPKVRVETVVNKLVMLAVGYECDRD